MVTASSFLDLRDLFVNEIAGSPLLFILVTLATIFFIAAYFKMSDGVTILLSSLFCIVMIFFGYWYLAIPVGLVAAAVWSRVIIRSIGAK